jgi:hypothetical protein
VSVSLPSAKFRSLIDALAAQARLPPWNYQGETWPGAVWLEGQVMQESSGDPRARRYEGHLDSVADGDHAGVDDGLSEDDASYGLLQVLGTNLRAMVGVAPGVPMNFSWALRPAAGLVFGVRFLCDECLAPVGGEGNVHRALARYNAGPRGTSMVPGPGGSLALSNQPYVDAVAKWTRRVAAEQLA